MRSRASPTPATGPQQLYFLLGCGDGGSSSRPLSLVKIGRQSRVTDLIQGPQLRPVLLIELRSRRVRPHCLDAPRTPTRQDGAHLAQVVAPGARRPSASLFGPYAEG